jgi:hypothetical protein
VLVLGTSLEKGAEKAMGFMRTVRDGGIALREGDSEAAIDCQLVGFEYEVGFCL